MRGGGFSIKVLLLGKYPLPRNGGVEHHLEALLKGFEAEGSVKATLLTTGPALSSQCASLHLARTVQAPRILDLRQLGIAGRPAGFLAAVVELLAVAPAYFLWLRRLSRGALVHLHTPNPMAEAAVLAVRPRGPLVVTEHCPVPPGLLFSPTYAGLHTRALAKASAIIVPTHRHLEASAMTADERARAHVVPYAVDVDERKADRESAQTLLDSLPAGAPTVLFVGRLVDYKGVEYLLDAMGEAPGRLVVVGDGPQGSALRAKATDSNLAGRVHFVGSPDDTVLWGLMALADVLVLPSVDAREGFGLVLLEAHRMGTPTISTEVGTGTSWVNEEGMTGFVVPPRDARALAGAIRKVAEDPARARAMGAAASERARAFASVEKMARETAEVYRAARAHHEARTHSKTNTVGVSKART